MERSKSRQKPRVVIVGGGYGGVYAGLRLERAARRGEIELSLVSLDNFFLFQPMLAEVVSGSIEPPHIVNPIRRLLRHTRFHQAEVEAVDLSSRTIVLRYPGGHAQFDSIPFDHLILAVGTTADLSRSPGMAEHGFAMKTLGDAFRLRNHVVEVIERAEVETVPESKAELLTFVVVGGGYTGVEVAAEINSFAREAAKDYPSVDPAAIRVVLVQGRDRILPELSPEQAAFSHRVMERRGVEILLNTRIEGASGNSATMSDGERIPTRTVVAAVGASPNRLLDTISASRDNRGRLIVNESLAVPEHPGVWAVGDCAAVPDARSGDTAPPTAQYALREGKHVGRNVLAAVRGEPLRPFRYKSLGVFVPLGRFSGAAEVMGLKVEGFLAWWMYRTYYLLQLPRLERKLRVMSDWTLELIFRRDIARVDLTTSQGTSRVHFQAGETVFRQGGPARNLYIVLEGSVHISTRTDGKDVPVATLGSGDFFGERSLLSGSRHSATAKATASLDLLVMSGGDFNAIARYSTRFEELLENVMIQRSTPRQDSAQPSPHEDGES